jgi:hypothetical protein
MKWIDPSNQPPLYFDNERKSFNGNYNCILMRCLPMKWITPSNQPPFERLAREKDPLQKKAKPRIL